MIRKHSMELRHLAASLDPPYMATVGKGRREEEEGELIALTNGINHQSDSDLDSESNSDSNSAGESTSTTMYTSLRDIIAGGGHPPPPPPPPMPAMRLQASTAPVPVTSSYYNNSWGGEMEVAISNPLVKQAAIAYLQPKMMTPPEIDGRGWSGRLRECLSNSCGGEGEREEGGGLLRCLEFVKDTFFGVIGQICGVCSWNQRGQTRVHAD